MAAFAGYLILIFSRNAALSYFAVFLGARLARPNVELERELMILILPAEYTH